MAKPAKSEQVCKCGHPYSQHSASGCMECYDPNPSGSWESWGCPRYVPADPPVFNPVVEAVCGPNYTTADREGIPTTRAIVEPEPPASGAPARHSLRPTARVQVWAEVDAEVADLVCYLQTIEGVTTHASCQGTIGEGGPEPYRAFVDASWTDAVLEQLTKEFDIEVKGDHWGYVHLREGWKPPTSSQPCAGADSPTVAPGLHSVGWNQVCKSQSPADPRSPQPSAREHDTLALELLAFPWEMMRSNPERAKREVIGWLKSREAYALDYSEALRAENDDLRAQLGEARHVMSQVDDVRLDQPLPSAIFDLSQERDRLRAENERLHEHLRGNQEVRNSIRRQAQQRIAAWEGWRTLLLQKCTNFRISKSVNGIVKLLKDGPK